MADEVGVSSASTIPYPRGYLVFRVVSLVIVCILSTAASAQTVVTKADAGGPNRAPSFRRAPLPPPRPASSFFGAILATNSPGWGRLLSRSDTTGALVLSVIPNSPAADAGLAPGDVIVAMDDHQVQNAERATVILQSTRSLQSLLTWTRPDGQARTVEAELLTSSRLSLAEHLVKELEADPTPVTRYLFAKTTTDQATGLRVADDLTREVPGFAGAHAVRAVQLLRQSGGGGPGGAGVALEDAKQAITLAVQLDPESTEIRAAAAQFWLAVNDLSQAEAQAARAVAIDGASPAAHYALGLAQLALGRADLALPDLHRAVLLNPYQPSYYQGLIRGYEALGLRSQARATNAALGVLTGGIAPRELNLSQRVLRAFLVIGALVLLGVGPLLVLRRRPGEKAFDPCRETKVASAAGRLAAVEALGALGAWAIAVPYLGPAFGLAPESSPKLAVTDHVLPGLAVLAISAASLYVLFRSKGGEGSFFLWAPGLFFLAGLWMVATHLPLVLQAGGARSWVLAIFHSSPGLPIVGLSIWLYLRVTRQEERALEAAELAQPGS